MQLKHLLVDITPLRVSRAFRYAYAARAATVLVTGMLMVAASIQIFALTQSTLAVAALNVCMAAPMGLALIVGGVLSDRLDRRQLMLWSRSVYIVGALIFLANALLPQPMVWPLYLAAVIGGAASGISVPAMMSATPALVGREHLAAAAALSGLAMQLGGVLGPLLAGALIAGPGLVFCYLIVLAGVVTTPMLLRALPPLPPLGAGQPGGRPQGGLFDAFIEGFRYMLATPLLRGLLLIDLAAIVLATPLALLPEWGEVVLGLGPKTTGMLYAAPATGAVIAALASGWTKSHPRPGLIVIAAVLIWGAAVAALSASASSLYASLIALAVMGAADTLSKVVRITLVQTHTPNHLLGRMSSLWMTESSLGTAAGNLQMGAVARWTSPSVALLVGGSACLLAGAAYALIPNALRGVEKKQP